VAFQEVDDMVVTVCCGSSPLASHRLLKPLAREIYANEVDVAPTQSLKYSEFPISFYHHNQMDMVSSKRQLSLVVSPIIYNM
jgi:hypothetical protein